MFQAVQNDTGLLYVICGKFKLKLPYISEVYCAHVCRGATDTCIGKYFTDLYIYLVS